MKKFLFANIFLFVLASYSCNNQSDKTKEPIAQISSEFDLSKGFTLTESYCFTCHSADASIDNRIAPPMIAIKKHYISENTSEEEFIQDLIHFVNNPSEDISKMPGAVEKFNLMPKMSFSEADLREIAHYIYQSDIEQPEWFEKHYQEEKKKYGQQETTEDLSYKEQGLKYAMGTKAILGKNLIGAINEKGASEALEFCNTKAIHLTDSMAQVQGVQIKRVSDLERNPANKANEEELAYILETKEIIKSEGKPNPRITELEDKVIGYYPIITNAMCMQCHGAPNTEIKTETLEKLNQFYPNDKAVGYGENELRGIWVVTIDK